MTHEPTEDDDDAPIDTAAVEQFKRLVTMHLSLDVRRSVGWYDERPSFEITLLCDGQRVGETILVDA